jgi:hypothetical protein
MIYQLLKCMEGFQCTVGIVLCHNGISTNGLSGSKYGHSSIKLEEGAGPATACMARLSAQMVLV